jgi:tRNA(Arg) A34 adenosine deaminase TadA
MRDMHEKFLKKTIEIALQSIECGGGPFGVLIVKNNEVISTGANQVVKRLDPTAHAEIVAIRNVCKQLQGYQLDGCTLYTSCEPCSMCLGAIYWARLDEVFYALTGEDAARVGFDDKFIYDELSRETHQRSLKMGHFKDLDAEKIFKKWQDKLDKKMY